MGENRRTRRKTTWHGDLDHDLCPLCHLLVRSNISSKFVGSIPKHCQVIKLFSTKSSGGLDLYPQDHLLVRTSISTKFEGANHKQCRIISFFDTKGHGDLWLKGHLLFRSILPISLMVLGLIIANGFLLYKKQVTTPLPPMGRASFHPHSCQRTSRQCYIQNIKGLGLAHSDKKIF